MSCVARAKITLSPGGWAETSRIHGLTVNEDQPIKLKCRPHPKTRVSNPHAHLGHTQLAENAVLHQKAHNPTGRVSLESVIRACITEYGATPMRDDWDKVLALREGDFQIYRTWS